MWIWLRILLVAAAAAGGAASEFCHPTSLYQLQPHEMNVILVVLAAVCVVLVPLLTVAATGLLAARAPIARRWVTPKWRDTFLSRRSPLGPAHIVGLMSFAFGLARVGIVLTSRKSFDVIGVGVGLFGVGLLIGVWAAVRFYRDRFLS